MRRIVTVGFALGFALFSAAAKAGAHEDRSSCGSCGAASTTRYYRTIHPVLYVTHYHDKSVYDHVTRLHYIVNVTRIQPIIQVQDVTRLHHVAIVRDAYAYQPQVPDPIPYPVVTYGCGCGGLE